MRRYLVPLLFGLGGFAVLVNLGLWQLRRLELKETRLAEIDARIAGTPVSIDGLDLAPGAEALRYTPVTFTGETLGPEILVLTSDRNLGPGYRVISAFETNAGRRVMVDRGFIPDLESKAARSPVTLTVTGNLHWPQETDSYTPPPDPVSGIWFARDVPAMAAKLQTDPLLVIVSKVDGDAQGIIPWPIDSSNIPNDHLQYAITWFSLGLVWLGMTVFLLSRIRRKMI